MWRKISMLFTITILCLGASACSDETGGSGDAVPPTPPSTPPTAGLSVNLINSQPKSVTTVIAQGSEQKIFHGTIINDKTPAEVQKQIDASLAPATPPPPADPGAKGPVAEVTLSVAPTSKDEATPAKKMDATGSYRVDTALTFQYAVPKDYAVRGVTPQQEYLVSGGGLKALDAARFAVVAPGKKLADGVAVLRNRKHSGNAEFSAGMLLFHEKAKAKDPGQWKLRNLAGEETALDLGKLDSDSAKIIAVADGFFLLQAGSANKDSTFGYAIVKSGDKSVVKLCDAGCKFGGLVRHPTDGVFVVYQDKNAADHPFTLATADLKKTWAIGADPAPGADEQIKSVVYQTSKMKFLPTGEFVFSRVVNKQMKTANGTTLNGFRTTTLFKTSDSTFRVVAEEKSLGIEDVLQAPQVQRAVQDVIAVVGDRVLLRTADDMWSIADKKVTDALVAEYLTWLAADGSKSDIISAGVGLRALQYWPETNRLAVQVNEAEPTIKIVKLDTGKVEAEINNAQAVPFVDDKGWLAEKTTSGASFWPFVLLSSKAGLAPDENKLVILGPYLDQAELGTVKGNIDRVIIADLATDAPPARVADETTVPQLTVEVQPASIDADATLKAKVQVIGSTPFDGVSGTIACDKANADPQKLPGTSDFAQDVVVTLNSAADATCTIAASDQLKSASAQFVVKAPANAPPLPPSGVSLTPGNFQFSKGLTLWTFQGIGYVSLSNGVYQKPTVKVSGGNIQFLCSQSKKIVPANAPTVLKSLGQGEMEITASYKISDLDNFGKLDCFLQISDTAAIQPVTVTYSK